MKRRSKARRAFRKTRRFARSSFGSRKRSRKSGSGFSTGSLVGTVVGAAVYGAGREWMSNKLAPITSKIPAGDLSDEVGMGVLSYFVAKGSIPLVNKIPYSREIGKAGLVIESARAGGYLLGKYMPQATTTSTTASGGWE